MTNTPNQASTHHWTERARYWIKWAEYLSSGDDEFTRHMFATLDLQAGHELLDLASGPGEPALKAAKTVGPKGLVVATDIVPEMIIGLRNREESVCFDHLFFASADMQLLPFPDLQFDRITCRFGIMFVDDPVRAFREMKRVLRPGGRVALMFWGPRDDTPIFSINHAVASEVLSLPAKQPEIANRYGAEGSILNTMLEAGLVNVEEVEYRSVKREPEGKPFWRPYFEMTFGPQLIEHKKDIMERVDQAMLRYLEPYRKGNEYHLSTHMRLAIGSAG